MRTRTFFLVCLVSVIANTRLFAQETPETKKNYTEVSVWSCDDWQPVYCDGKLVDELTGTLTVHTVDHVKDGIWTLVSHMYGEDVSAYTGEVFKVTDAIKGYPFQSLDAWHFNLIGNKGTHYVGSMKYYYGDWWDPTDDVIYIDKVVCLYNKAK